MPPQKPIRHRKEHVLFKTFVKGWSPQRDIWEIVFPLPFSFWFSVLARFFFPMPFHAHSRKPIDSLHRYLASGQPFHFALPTFSRPNDGAQRRTCTDVMVVTGSLFEEHFVPRARDCVSLQGAMFTVSAYSQTEGKCHSTLHFQLRYCTQLC